MIKIVRTKEEVAEVMERVMDLMDERSTRYHGMTYLEGLEEMYNWLTGEQEDPPVE